MWFAIFVTVLAASGNNIGKVLQKQATRTLPKLTLKREVVEQYLKSRTWTAGMLTDLAGALLMLVAFANAPVSVVQPVSAVGLVVLLIFSHFYLKERLCLHEWIAAAVAGVGVIGLGASAEQSHLEHPTAPPMQIVACFLALVVLLGLECWWRHWVHGSGSSRSSGSSSSGVNINGSSSFKVQQMQHSGAGGAGGAGSGGSFSVGQGGGGAGGGAAGSGAGSAAAAADAAMCGLEAGACFGLSAAASRTGFILARKVSILWVPLGLSCSVALTTTGFVLQTRGLKAGNTIIVCTMAAVSSMGSGVIAGLFALHERMPSGHGMKLVRLASWMCIMLGVTALAGGRKGMSSFTRLLASWLPPPSSSAWRYIPRSLALMLHKMEKSVAGGDEDGLPIVEPGAAGGPGAAAAAAAGGGGPGGGNAIAVSIDAGDKADGHLLRHPSRDL